MPPPRPIPSATGSSSCASRTSRSTTSAAPCTTRGSPLGPVAVSQVLKAEGFARLPRRADDERPPGPRPTTADVADVRQLDLTPRQLRTRFGGLFLFLPTLASIPFDRIARQAGLPGSRMIPAGCALRSLLALKLFGTARHPHVMSAVLDEGLALFAGLNAIPKRSFLTEYSCRIDPACYPKLMRLWFDAMSGLGLERGRSFDLDFHTIPYHGDDALVEKHYVSKRSRRQKGVLAFLAQDADTRVFCYANAELRKAEQSDEVLRFVRFWKRRTGHYPDELIFDSKLTTYAKLDTAEPAGDRTSSPCGGAPPRSSTRSGEHPRPPGGGSSWRASRGRSNARASSTAGSP